MLRELGDSEAAENRLQALLHGRDEAHFASVDAGLRGYKARHNLAILYHEQGRLAEAEAQWREALRAQLDFQPAQSGLVELHRMQERSNGAAATVRPGPGP